MTLHATTTGNGPLLVMLHGWGLNSRVWDSVLPVLGDHFTLVCLDLPGHGGSSWPPDFHDIDSLADLIATSIAEISGAPGAEDNEGVFVMGWSLGAMAALALAARRPELVRRLVLVAATPKFLRSADWPDAVEESALNDMAARLSTDFAGTVRDFLMWQVHGDEHARDALKTLRAKVKAGGEASPQALRAGLDTLARTDLRPRLSGIDCPTLVISGEHDRLSHPRAGAALAAALPQSRYHCIDRAAHAPFLSHAQEFCAQATRFLAAPA